MKLYQAYYELRDPFIIESELVMSVRNLNSYWRTISFFFIIKPNLVTPFGNLMDQVVDKTLSNNVMDYVSIILIALLESQ